MLDASPGRGTSEAMSDLSAGGGRVLRTYLIRGLVMLAALAALYASGTAFRQWWTVGRYMVSTDDAYVGARSATISPKIAGYVTEVVVVDNASVKAGDLIARIDPGDYQLSLRSARGGLETQRATVSRIARQVDAQRSLVDQANAQLDAVNAGAAKAVLDLKRQTDLAARKINSAQALEQAQALDLQAKAAVVAAAAAVANASANVAVFEAQRIEAEAGIKQAETAIARAERELSFTEIRAAFDGVVGNRAVQVGDLVQPAQRLMSLVPMHALYIDANFKETQLALLRPGQRVHITVDAHAGETIEGQVVSFAPASGSVFSLLPPDNATGNFTKIVQRVPVRIAIPQATIDRAHLRPGMSVVVAVDTRTGPRADTPALMTSDRALDSAVRPGP